LKKLKTLISMQGNDFLKNLWRDLAGLPELPEQSERMPDLHIIRKIQWCPEFEELMRNRLVMGAFRYGLVDQKKSKSMNHMSSVRKRLDRYEETGNLEFLADVANLMMLEFMHCDKSNKKFIPLDDGIHSSPKI
jgi:hypothetical protein